MKGRNEQAFQRKKAEIMEACFNCYAENGLTGTGIQALADACGLSKASLYTYFDTLDDLIVESTAYCMSKVEDDFMQLAPTGIQDISRFIDEVPYWTAEHYSKKYRLMYQVYTHPKYIEHGKAFFAGVNERYHSYARQLEPLMGMPCDVITPTGVPIILYAGDEPAGPLALTQEQQDLLRQAALADKQTQALESLVSQRRSNYTIETHPEWLTVSS